MINNTAVKVVQVSRLGEGMSWCSLSVSDAVFVSFSGDPVAEEHGDDGELELRRTRTASRNNR